MPLTKQCFPLISRLKTLSSSVYGYAKEIIGKEVMISKETCYQYSKIVLQLIQVLIVRCINEIRFLMEKKYDNKCRVGEGVETNKHKDGKNYCLMRLDNVMSDLVLLKIYKMVRVVEIPLKSKIDKRRCNL